MIGNLNSPWQLNGKVALVTGGGRGIGAAICEVLAFAGAFVVVVNRTAEVGEQVAQSIRSMGGQAIAIAADIGVRSEVDRVVLQAVQKYGRLDIVVHNAAVCPWEMIENVSDEQIEHTLTVNLQAAFWLTKAALPHWRVAGKGRLLFTSSVTGPRVAMPGSAHYAASKAGLNGFIRTAAMELAKDKVTVNGVEPGYIAKVGGSLLSDPEKAARIKQYIPLGDLGKPEDIANAMLFLASESARYITGQTIVVDGGSTLPESPFFLEE
ncbi:3-oxoacyl-[acyl-carrier-protein] reductase FabG [Ephemeroptericola cinctiostellae]|uniref:3-oxoacyl-[acyl-carrier-protein] reductase FabG n=1 Tax=Ephemeroptericola cinctiostellae TaxID=2268024 RepID=A0A345DCA7_9BURK|nr:SDR family oxidoreductase [Ephemeroptericola cinctiostellae]AXF85995.1 3-oxoacyl-[acyl-carrier-protein] reductase FabG [Ephemeroptericola cinctiostellae]